MPASESKRRSPSTTSVERSFKKNNFGTIVRALWPDKPALNLSQRIGCSERAAQFYIDGERKPSARAVLAIVGEALD
jgi:hypothetical protein